MSLNGRKISGVLLDITGVLMESSSVEETGLDIPGSVEAVKKLVEAGLCLFPELWSSEKKSNCYVFVSVVESVWSVR